MRKQVILCISILLFHIPLFSCQHDESHLIKQQYRDHLHIPETDLSVTRFAAGVSNRVYLVSTSAGGKYVAKIFTKRSLDDVLTIEKHASALRQLGFNIPQTLAITQLQNSLPLQLSLFEQGEHLTDNELPVAARILAELHLKAPSICPAPKEKYKRDDHFQNLFVKCKNWASTEELQKIYKDLDISYLNDIPTGVIHGDFSYTNLIITGKNKITLIDFDHICTSYLLSDVVRCQMFYGFDEAGQIQEDKITLFASCYDANRPLTLIEKQHFYTHMKLMMIDTALEMYNHMYVIQDLPEEIVASDENKTLMPELLVRKIKNLVNKEAIELSESPYVTKMPIVFLGLSGAGKTTLIHALKDAHPDTFYIPIFTCTRNPRPDDTPDEFTYVTMEEFRELDQKKAFALTMHEGERYYGYQKSHLSDPKKHPLINCSALSLENAKELQPILVLIQGDAEKGLQNRNNPEELQKRTLINQRLFNQYFSQDWFISQIDIVHINEWQKKRVSAKNLTAKIFEKINARKAHHDEYRKAA